MRSELEHDTRRLDTLIGDLRDTLGRESQRRTKLATLECEARVVLARFPALDPPKIQPVARREKEHEDSLLRLTQIGPTYPRRFQPVGISAGMTDNAKRRATLRSLAEYVRNSSTGDTEGGALVLEAGLDVPLSDTERRIAEDKKAAAARDAAQLARIAPDIEATQAVGTSGRPAVSGATIRGGEPLSD